MTVEDHGLLYKLCLKKVGIAFIVNDKSNSCKSFWKKDLISIAEAVAFQLNNGANNRK
jgi:hypothetical protein